MTVVDSSVWIANLRGLLTPQVVRLMNMARQEQIIVGDLILAEVLQGARDEAQAAKIEQSMRRYTVRSMAGEDIAVKAARNYRTLRGQGITVRKTIDIFIGTYCIEGGHSLLHDDRDFDPMETHLGLIVVR